MKLLMVLLREGWEVDMKSRGNYFDVAARHPMKELYVANWEHTFLKDAISCLYKQAKAKEKEGEIND